MIQPQDTLRPAFRCQTNILPDPSDSRIHIRMWQRLYGRLMWDSGEWAMLYWTIKAPIHRHFGKA